MKSVITRSLTVSLAMAAVIALPTAVRAQADNLPKSTAVTSEEQLDTDTNWCFPIPGYGLYCG